jgi:Ethanolamine utilization protein EutJ (predicted chaperonin)
MQRVVEMNEKEIKREKNKYHSITFWILPEVEEKLDDLLHHYIRETLKQTLNKDDKELLSITRSEMNKFFKNYLIKHIYVYTPQYDIWKTLPLGIRKRHYYLVNKKLMEVLNDELQTTRSSSTS